MDSYLIDRNSPIRSTMSHNLRHRSRHSESDGNNAPESCQMSLTEDDQERKKINASNVPQDEELKEDDEIVFPQKSKSMLSYFLLDLTGGKCKIENESSEFAERRKRIYTSVHTPKSLEKFCAFGLMQCLDSILYIVTFLPLRIIVALIRVITFPFAVIFKGRRQPVLDAGLICDLLKGLIVVVTCFIVSHMDMSMIYHLVRGQSIIKFYVFFNMLDVLDKMISGFGQDVLDSLYWTAVEPRRKREHFGTLFHLAFAIVYVFIHTVMILTQAVILNVAFNSYNKNLLTIMMSNNFVEIKANLFKRLDKKNLCQITYSDVKERFHYLVLLLVVFIRNMTELQWTWDKAYPILVDGSCVLGVEILVDWAKHGFITKFNELSHGVYAEFALGLAEDIASSKKKHAFTDFSDQVCRRMGFTPIPLVCLLYMVCSSSFEIRGPFPWFLLFLLYLCLVSTKVLTSILILGWAQHLIKERDKEAKPSGTVVNSQVCPKREEKVERPKPSPEPLPTTEETDSSVPLLQTEYRSDSEVSFHSAIAPSSTHQNSSELLSRSPRKKASSVSESDNREAAAYSKAFQGNSLPEETGMKLKLAHEEEGVMASWSGSDSQLNPVLCEASDASSLSELSISVKPTSRPQESGDSFPLSPAERKPFQPLKEDRNAYKQTNGNNQGKSSTTQNLYEISVKEEPVKCIPSVTENHEVLSVHIQRDGMPETNMEVQNNTQNDKDKALKDGTHSKGNSSNLKGTNSLPQLYVSDNGSSPNSPSKKLYSSLSQ